MDKEALEQRLAELREIFRQIESNGNATLGAISECEHWLAVIAKAEQAKETK